MTSEVQYALDTSVAVPYLVAAHQAHAQVKQWAKGKTLGLSGHALIETYSVLTRLPGESRLTPKDAVALIDSNFASNFDLPASVASRAPAEFAKRGVAGGATYDGLVALAAHEHRAVLATRDARARSTYEALGVVVEIVG